jgi:hypothetical protein
LAATIKATSRLRPPGEGIGEKRFVGACDLGAEYRGGYAAEVMKEEVPIL